MIKINLLPPEMQGKKAKRASRGGAPSAPGEGGFKALLAVVAIVFLAAWAVAGYLVYSKVSQSRQNVATQQKLHDKVKAEHEEKWPKYADMMANLERMERQQEILEVLMPENRLLWAEKLQMLSELIPPGVYISELRLSEETELVETQASKTARAEYDKKKKAAKQGDDIGPEPKVIKKPRITQTLAIQALSVGDSNTDRWDKMLAFESALRTFKREGRKGDVRTFMDNFKPEIEFGLMQTDEIQGMRVWSFEFRLNTKSILGSGDNPS